MSLAGKRILVTGGSSGIGLAVARALAVDEGADVTIAGRSRTRLLAAKAAVARGVSTYELDVTDESAISQMFAQRQPFDHVVTAAASVVMAPALEMPTSAFRALVESKLYGQFLVARHAAPHLPPDGSITLFSGTVTQKPMAGATAYAAVGAAAEAMARVMALELAPRRVNSVVPGVIDTPAWDALFDAETKTSVLGQIASSLPVGRIGTTNDVAQAVIFLMRNSFVNGIALVVDGGHRLI
ncbi:MAG: SDR family oxidoreductase [Chloroflexi bacterium]|nr:SDR family oxidoreductase [Chloroflexota bacterium]